MSLNMSHDSYLWDLLLAAGHLCYTKILSPFLPCGGFTGKSILSSTPLTRCGSDMHSPDLKIKREVGKYSKMLIIKNTRPFQLLRKVNL